MAVTAEHRRNNNTLHWQPVLHSNIWDINYNKAERQLTKNTVRTEARKKKNLPEKKNHSREKTQEEIWVGSMDHALKSPSYEGLSLIHI